MLIPDLYRVILFSFSRTMNKRRKRILQYVLSGITLGFIILTTGVSIFPNSLLDLEFSEEVQEHNLPLLNSLMTFVSLPGYMPASLIMVLVTAALFALFRYYKEAFFTLLTLLSGLISYTTKILVDRPRPSSDVVRVIQNVNSHSFPSGHVLLYVVFFGFLIIAMHQQKKIPEFLRILTTVISLFFIFAIPFSRIYLGAHWFTDVLGGFMLGLIALFILSYYYLKKA